MPVARDLRRVGGPTTRRGAPVAETHRRDARPPVGASRVGRDGLNLTFSPRLARMAALAAGFGGRPARLDPTVPAFGVRKEEENA